jgi:hypothetical protein
MTNPANVRAAAPVARLAVLDSLGRLLLLLVALVFTPLAGFVLVLALPSGAAATRRLRATRSLNAFKLEKYNALPNPVRSALGSVPRQNWRIGCGLAASSLIVARSVVARDCWTRVLRRSAGCRRTADKRPDPKPAAKWTLSDDQLVNSASKGAV